MNETELVEGAKNVVVTLIISIEFTCSVLRKKEILL